MKGLRALQQKTTAEMEGESTQKRKAEQGGRTKNIPETAKCEVQRGMGGGGVCAEKGGWRGKQGSGQGRAP